MPVATGNPRRLSVKNSIYSSIAGEMRSRIVSGEWIPGQQITSEKKLAEEFSVCHSTVKKSLRILEREGLLWSKRGKGRFVSDTKSRRKTWTIGVVLFDQKHLAHPVTSEHLSGIQEVLGEAGYHLKLTAMNTLSVSIVSDISMSLVELVTPSSIDGALVMAQEANRFQVERLAQHVPVVWLNHQTINPTLLGVKDDYIGGAYAAAKHLLELGHRNIALLTTQETFDIACEQRNGAQLAMREIISTGRGKLYALHGGREFTIESGKQLARRLLDLPTRPTAAVCGSDEIAIGAFEVLTQAGLNVPDDISMVAWNDTLTAGQIPVPMTTVRIDFNRAAARSTRILLELVDKHKKNPEREFDQIQAELIVRESTAPPKEANRTSWDQ